MNQERNKPPLTTQKKAEATPVKQDTPMEQDDPKDTTEATVDLDTIDTGEDLFDPFSEDLKQHGSPIDNDLETQPGDEDLEKVSKDP